MEHEIEFNDDKSKGRTICSCGHSTGASIAFYSYIYFGVTIILLLIMAQATSRFPSLFNETHVIFGSTVTTVVIVALGAGVILVTNDPTTSPAVEYIVKVFVCLSITLQTSYRIMIPKLRMIWNGENVIVSKLVSDTMFAE